MKPNVVSGLNQIFSRLRQRLGNLSLPRKFPRLRRGRQSVVLGFLRPTAESDFVELVIELAASRQEMARYRYSKLYYACDSWSLFSEDSVICFEVPRYCEPVRLQIMLPEMAWKAAQKSGVLRLRIDGLPYSEGLWSLIEVKLVNESLHPELSRDARRLAHRQWVREQVLLSETQGRVTLPHYPESVSVELTTLCNLRCPHCSSHGRPHLHKHHNGLSEMPLERFNRLAEETFPHASVVSAVGRGEPTLVSDVLWSALFDQLRKHGVRLSCVTNGTRIRERFNDENIGWLHEITVSIDGGTAATFEKNRLGANYVSTMESLSYFHELRTRNRLARRPLLTISWTLKRNNLHELMGFIHQVAPFEPDLLSIRHMVIFQDKERPESLLDIPDEANAVLTEVYAELDRLGIRHESPPLMAVAASADDSIGRESASVRAPTDGSSEPSGNALEEREAICNWMQRTAIIMYDGEVTTCGKHYGLPVGYLDEEDRFFEIWNGPKMRSLREGFGKPSMWDQCKACWLREVKWYSQRTAKDLLIPYRVSGKMDFSDSAWDYRQHSEL